MKYKIIISLSVLLFFFEGCKSQKIIRENIEWSDFWWPNEPDSSKPRVLFVGNSISRGYFPAVSAILADKANCDRYSSSRSIEDPALIQETKMAMAKYNHAVIHFNNGLHGWHLSNEQYEKGLRKYVKFLNSNRSKSCKLIYSLTTPYPSQESGQKLNPVKNKIVMDRNRIACQIMKENNIPIIDLYSLMEKELEKYNISKGDLHYNEEGYKKMAEVISIEILKLMGK